MVSAGLGVADQGLHPLVKPEGVANYAQAHALGIEVANLFLQIPREQANQAADLVERAAPVFCAERKECEVRNAALCAGLHNGAHPSRASAVAHRLG